MDLLGIRTVETTVTTDSPTTAAAVREATIDFTKIKEELRNSYATRESQIRNQMALERQKLEIESRALADQLDIERLKNKESASDIQRLKEELKLMERSRDVGAEVKKQSYESEVHSLRLQNEELAAQLSVIERQKTLLEVDNDEKNKVNNEAITAASTAMEGQTQHIRELDSQVAMLTHELSVQKAQSDALASANSRHADDSEKLGVLEARVASLTRKLDIAHSEIKHVTDTKTFEIEELQRALSNEAKRASAAVQEQLSIMSINEQATTSEVRELQSVISNLVAQQKQREVLCDSLRGEIAEKDQTIADLKRRLQAAHQQSTEVNTSMNQSLHSQQELWHNERIRLEKEAATATRSYKTLKTSLEQMITQLEKRLSVEATERHNEKLHWEDAIKVLTQRLNQSQAELSDIKQSQNISDASIIPRVPEAKSASEDILTRIETHLCDAFRRKDDESVTQILRQELDEKKSEIERLSKKYRSAKKKLSKSMQETDVLTKELSAHQSAILVQREVDARRKLIASGKHPSPRRRVPSPTVAFRNNTAHRLTWQKGSLLGQR
eukprot:TRINITY_DN33725_c0_g1_i1.p1 TRINITY_DN33725_c0_g1~~TRINITY_DN33725_c0_g1_i1.p1  ORF type:complete len:558 (+),score=136.70 TRINITY_DN33725_c0_g1_i1:78-1751(+)